uniref:Acyl-CoA dehydrogenase long chain n=1 Tax=Electrophorus electricus TaxID=8005 RepID=A0A4W4GM44_ELEEL
CVLRLAAEEAAHCYQGDSALKSLCSLQYSECQHTQGEAAAPVRPETSMAKTLMDIGTQYHLKHFVCTWEKAGAVSRGVWEKAGSQGLLCVYTPAEHGRDLLSAAIVWEEQMYSNCSGPGFSLYSEIVMPYISHYGTQAQVELYIPQMAVGKCIGAIAMMEQGAGSDLQGVKTYARKDGWLFLSQVFITNGWMSDLVVVVAVMNCDAKSVAHGLSLLLVENGTKEFHKGHKLDKIGLKSSVMNEERFIIAIMALAGSEFMFEETQNCVLQRKAFGKVLLTSFIDNCLQLHSKGKLDSSTESRANYWASDLQKKVATQLHGGCGYIWAFVDARVQPMYGGTNEIMKELIAHTIIRHK